MTKKGHHKFLALKWKIWHAKLFVRFPKLGAKSPPMSIYRFRIPNTTIGLPCLVLIKTVQRQPGALAMAILYIRFEVKRGTVRRSYRTRCYYSFALSFVRSALSPSERCFLFLAHCVPKRETHRLISLPMASHLNGAISSFGINGTGVTSGRGCAPETRWLQRRRSWSCCLLRAHWPRDDKSDAVNRVALRRARRYLIKKTAVTDFHLEEGRGRGRN